MVLITLTVYRIEYLAVVFSSTVKIVVSKTSQIAHRFAGVGELFEPIKTATKFFMENRVLHVSIATGILAHFGTYLVISKNVRYLECLVTDKATGIIATIYS